MSAWDPPTLSGVITVMLTVAGLASLLPAVRASRVEPTEVLRMNKGSAFDIPMTHTANGVDLSRQTKEDPSRLRSFR